MGIQFFKHRLKKSRMLNSNKPNRPNIHLSMRCKVLFDSKRIILVPGSLELGGTERQALQLALYLKKLGGNVEVWGFSKPGRLAQLCDHYKIPWRRVFFQWPRDPVRRIIYLVSVGLELRSSKPDIILPFATWANVTAGLTWRWTQAKTCIWNQRDLGLFGMGDYVEKLAIQKIPTFISNSQHGADFLVQTYKVNRNRIHVIHNGISLEPPVLSRIEWRRKLGLSNSIFVACMVANVTERKDHETLINAWRHVVNRSDAIMLLAGFLGDSYLRMKSLVQELNLSRNIFFLDQVDDVSGLLEAVELGLYSSKLEGCPNGVLECMAAGLAVAGTNIPGIREAVGPEGYPYLAEPGDAEGLADRIVALMKDKKMRNNLGATFKHRVDIEFSLSRMCEETAELLVQELTNFYNA